MKWPFPLPAWLDEGFRYVGLREIPGKSHNKTITKWLISLKAWWTDDETPWCGTFVAWCLKSAGLVPPVHWYRAKAYSDYGTPVPVVASQIPFGAICIKSRTGGGHVFFAVGRSADGKTIYGLGGNQSNMVNITAFPINGIDAVRWPAGATNAPRNELPITTKDQLNAWSSGGSEA